MNYPDQCRDLSVEVMRAVGQLERVLARMDALPTHSGRGYKEPRKLVLEARNGLCTASAFLKDDATYGDSILVYESPDDETVKKRQGALAINRLGH